MRELLQRAYCAAFTWWVQDKNPQGHPVETFKFYLFRWIRGLENAMYLR